MKNSKIYANNPFQRGILNTVLIAALFLAVTISPLAYSHGQDSEKSADAIAATAEQKNRAKELNLQLDNLMTEYKSADTASSSGLANQLATLAGERWQILGELIENDPAEVLRQALPDDVLDRMPAKAQAFLEQRMVMEGELQLLHVDYNDPGQSHYVYLLSTDTGEKYSLHFANHGPDIQSSTRVRINGIALYGIKARDAGETEGAVAVNDGDSGLQLLEAGGSTTTTSTSTTTGSLPNTLGAQKTLVILVNFSDNSTQPYTPATAQSVVFGTASNFFLENSYQQTWLTGDVVGWFTIYLSATVCDTNTIASQAKAAASTVVNLSSYAHLVYAFPQNNNCGWAGLSSVGGSPSQAWINGSLGVHVVAHELGHGFGLWHSHSLNCGTTTLGTNCTTVEYGDVVDTMGGPLGFLSAAHFNAFQKERLGWLNAGASPEITTVQTDGTYMLEPYETGGSGPKALKILKSTDPTTGKRTWYYVESRQAIGFDAFLATNSSIASNTNVPNGVLLHMGTESNGNSIKMLDLRPDTSNWWDPALAVGESFEDPDAGVSITVESVTGMGAAVTVSFGTGGAPSTGLPSVGVSTDQSSYTRSQTVTTTAMVTAGGSPVANAKVIFSFSKPNGAVVTATATTGTNGSAVYKLRLKKQDPVGTYQAAAEATSNAFSASAVTNFTVQ